MDRIYVIYNRINCFSDIGGDGIYITCGVDNDDIVSVLEQFKRAVIPLADGIYLLRVALKNFEIHAPVFYSLMAALRVDIEEDADIRLEYARAVEVHIYDPLPVLPHCLIGDG